MKETDIRILLLINHLGKSNKINNIVTEMAQYYNITPSYLKQLFKQQTGKTILQYDKDLRLEKAKKLFETTFKRVNEVCFEVGFKDYSHFERDFHKKFGFSPSRLQKDSRSNLIMKQFINNLSNTL